MTRPSISRTVRALMNEGIRVHQITVHSDGSFDVLTEAKSTPSDALFQKLEKRVAQGRSKAR